MVYAETLLSYPYWTIQFTVHTDNFDKQLGAFICQNNKPISFFSRVLINPKLNYTRTEKELLAIVECLKQLRVILFGYEINLFTYHQNMVYATTLSGSQRVMLWRLILKYFGPNIQHISRVDNIVADALSRLTYMVINKYKPCTRKAHCRANELFAIGRVENNEDCFPLNLLVVKIERQNRTET